MWTRRTLLTAAALGGLAAVGIFAARSARASVEYGSEEPADEPLWTDSVMSWLDNLTQASRENELKWRGLIETTEDAHGMPRGLLSRLLYQESRYRTDIITGNFKSSTGASGIAQFMPETGEEYGLVVFDKPRGALDRQIVSDRRSDPNAAIPASGRYLRKLFDSFGDWRLALAAYNAGPGNVRKWGGIPPFKETQDYVAQIAFDIGLA